MTNNLKHMIKQINDGNNLEEYLPQYANKYLSSNYKYSLLRLSMEYFTLYQVVSEEENKFINQIKDPLDLISRSISEVFSEDFDAFVSESIVEDLDSMRKQIINKMQILTSYTDQLQIYEFVLNRIELKFEQEHEVLDESVFLQRLVSYLFSSKDNMVINENIKQVIGQLPVRMTKEKYFELVRDSLSIYNGADKSSVDTYLYMLRTSAMLYQPEGTSEYFVEFKELIDELEKVNYNELTEVEYQRLAAKIPETAQQITRIVDLYVRLEEVLNNLYTLVLTEPYVLEPDQTVTSNCKEIIKGINELFCNGHFEMIPESIENKLFVLEGHQEVVYTEISLMESVLHEIRINRGEIVESLMLGSMFERLYLMEKLLSPSIFIELNQDEMEEVADSNYIERVTNELIVDLKKLFEQNQQCMKRAIIANTINKMPVFFNSSDEVVDYIKNSLEQCHDLAEKNACINLLSEIMEQ